MPTAKLPEEGDKGLSDTAKQVSLLLGTYSLKAFDFIKEKDAEGGYSAQLVEKIKGGNPSSPRPPLLAKALAEVCRGRLLGAVSRRGAGRRTHSNDSTIACCRRYMRVSLSLSVCVCVCVFIYVLLS